MNCGLKCDVQNYTPYSSVHVEVIQNIRWTSPVNLSYDRSDFAHVRYNCWRHEKMMWPIFASSFRMPWIFWISGRNKLGFPATLPINPPKYAFFSLPWELDAASGFWISSCPRVRFPCGCFEYPDLSRMRNLSEQLKTSSSPSALILPQLFPLLFVPASSSPSFWGSWSSCNSQRSKWSWYGWCWTNKEACSIRHVWNCL